ncbi:MAG: DNA polymerase domain-containing protein [Candidatus Nanopelagicales bacterium]
MAKEFGEPIEIEVDGHAVKVSNPDRPYFPTVGITKREVVQHYLDCGEGILRALRERPTTLERWPGGVVEGARISTREGFKGEAFYQKRVPQGAPSYVETARITFPSGRTADEIAPTSLAVIAYAANLGTITFHPWPVRMQDVEHPDELRLDLDPQPGSDFSDAVAVAHELKALLEELGMVGWPKTSGGRGIHVYVRIEPRWEFTDVRHAAIAAGRELERRMPGRITTKWWKEERPDGTIFLDYNQNARDRTIASAYSIRSKPHAPVSMPIRWDELDDVSPFDFTVRTAGARFAEVGDLHAGIDDAAYDLSVLLEMYARDEADGFPDLPYPPDYPKMAGEPKRVQPSKDKDRPRG